MGTFSLKPEQDGMGYFYGEYVTNAGEHVRVDLLPPKSHPRPLFVVTTEGMHETDWLVYANGEEIARVKDRDQVENELVKALTGE